MIGVFDSGIGGLTVLDELVKVLPNYDFIYYGDSKNNPFGEKNDEQLIKICCDIVDYLKEEGCRLIVIACNSATTRCIKKLRILYPELIFVGTVPAIKVASDRNFKNTLVMATPATIESESISELIKNYKRENQKIYLASCAGLANAIENHQDSKINEILDDIFKDYYNKEIDSIVLGCTHYPIIKDKISAYIPNATILDGAKGVAKEVKHQLELNEIFSDNNKGNVLILNSKVIDENKVVR